MFSIDQISELHLELSESCNAACPMCGRYQANGLENVNLKSRQISLKNAHDWFPPAFIGRLSRLRLCGNFGDPAVAKDVISILEYFRCCNPGLAFSFHTNGGLRDREWWYQLGRLFRHKKDELIFAIDGLEDTLGLYRRGVSYLKVISHADAALRAGAHCHWVMLVFEHNEHQIDQARIQAQDLGFSSFRLKATKRFGHDDQGKQKWNWPVHDRQGAQVYQINAPRNVALRNKVLISIDSSNEVEIPASVIRCHALDRKSLYVSAEGLVFPCCWMAASIYPAERQGPQGDIAKLLSEYGGLEAVSLNYSSIESILRQPVYGEVLQNLWNSSSPAICAQTCNQSANAFRAQFIEETTFRNQNLVLFKPGEFSSIDSQQKLLP